MRRSNRHFIAVNLDKLRKVQRTMERQNLGISLRSRKRNEWIRNKTKGIDAVQLAAKLTWKCAGHGKRFQDKR